MALKRGNKRYLDIYTNLTDSQFGDYENRDYVQDDIAEAAWKKEIENFNGPIAPGSHEKFIEQYKNVYPKNSSKYVGDTFTPFANSPYEESVAYALNQYIKNKQAQSVQQQTEQKPFVNKARLNNLFDAYQKAQSLADAAAVGASKGLANTTNTSNPVPTVPTVQQEQRTVLDEQKNMADASANASYQRMLKYLPQLNKDRGYAGLGISEATKAEAWNDYQTRLAQLAMGYAAAEKSEATSQIAMNYLSEELGAAKSEEEAQEIINRYRGLITDSDIQLLNAAMGSRNWADLYKQNAATAAQNELYTSLANAGYNANGGVSFNANKTNRDGWWGASKWVPGDGFSVKDASGNKYNVEIAEVYQSGDGKINDAALQYAVNSADTGDVFRYGNDLYMVRDVVRNGELTRDVYKLKQSGGKTQEFGDLMRLYKQQSELS